MLVLRKRDGLSIRSHRFSSFGNGHFCTDLIPTRCYAGEREMPTLICTRAAHSFSVVSCFGVGVKPDTRSDHARSGRHPRHVTSRLHMSGNRAFLLAALLQNTLQFLGQRLQLLGVAFASGFISNFFPCALGQSEGNRCLKRGRVRSHLGLLDEYLRSLRDEAGRQPLRSATIVLTIFSPRAGNDFAALGSENSCFWNTSEEAIASNGTSHLRGSCRRGFWNGQRNGR